MKIAIHEPTQTFVHVDNAERGLACKCICPECEQQLEAVKGEIRDWHFRHHKESDCKGGQETALHKLVKQIICEANQIAVPTKGKVNYGEAIQEKSIGQFRADVGAKSNGKELLFEVVVFHETETRKRDFYQKEELNSLEILFMDYPFDIPKFEVLKARVLESVENKEVIYWEPEPMLQQIAPTSTQPDNSKELTGSEAIGHKIFFGIIGLGFIWWLWRYLSGKPSRKGRASKY